MVTIVRGVAQNLTKKKKEASSLSDGGVFLWGGGVRLNLTSK